MKTKLKIRIYAIPLRHLVYILRIIKIKIMNWFYSGMLSLSESLAVSSFKETSVVQKYPFSSLFLWTTEHLKLLRCFKRQFPLTCA